ncbi:MAG: hypothetical protein R3E95_18490 [Thiolinea sp.]
MLLIQGIVIRRTFRKLDRIRQEVRELEDGRRERLSSRCRWKSIR